jgi:hypothetical protein
VLLTFTLTKKAKEVVAELKKEKHGLLKQERALKEDLASEVDNKDTLDDKVGDFVREKIEKDTTLEKSFKNMESIALKQRDQERQLRDAKKLRAALAKKLAEFDTIQSESKLLALQERAKEVEAQLRFEFSVTKPESTEKQKYTRNCGESI